MKDFAIFNYSEVGKGQGGPCGYLYNLLEGLKEISIDVPFFSISHVSVNNIKVKSVNKIRNPFLEEMRSILYYIKKGWLCSKRVNKELYNFKTVHVHSCEDFYYLRKYARYKGNIILTSHRPEPLANERATALKLKIKTKWDFPLLRFQMRRIEEYAYKYSSGFIFPSEGAMKIYNEFPGYARFSKNKPVGFVFTGTGKDLPTISSIEYRRGLSLSVEDKIVSFIGRHNYIKGYDLLVKSANRLEKEGIKVVCAGTNNALPAPQNKSWIELGHIKDPSNLINASDVVVVPNRNTYFDLIIIEILSLGKIVITTDTGGNIDISHYTKGIRMFKSGDCESLYKTIIETLALSFKEREAMSYENIQFYNKYCTISKFAENYIQAINQISQQYLTR